MLGVKKVRRDFNVTGDLDGNETIHTKNDVVIAILDTGIDASHVNFVFWFIKPTINQIVCL
ncbi:MAG: hypothetical protein MJA31_12760 [Clostridia bacterium]|nr:hypothetical protein [Clostridia bacterium]